MKNQFIYHSPIGNLYITTQMNELIGIKHTKDVDLQLCNTVFIQKIIKQLDEYFNKKRTTFDIPINLTGTDFQLRVYQHLLKVPYGHSVSYQDIAKALGNQNKARPVGGALNKNPIMIIVPCHRVIGKNGSLTGFAGGTHIKKVLLELEQKT